MRKTLKAAMGLALAAMTGMLGLAASADIDPSSTPITTGSMPFFLYAYGRGTTPGGGRGAGAKPAAKFYRMVLEN